MKSKLMIGVGMVVVVIAILYLVSAGTGTSDLRNFIKGSPKVECTVSLKDFLIGKPQIDRAQCVKTQETCLNPFSLQQLGVTRVEGTILFETDDTSKQVPFDISRFHASPDFTEFICTKDADVTIKLLADNGELIESKTVVIQ